MVSESFINWSILNEIFQQVKEALYHALQRNNIEIIRLLLSHGADPNSHAFVSLLEVERIILIFVCSFIFSFQRNRSALSLAIALTKSVDVVKLLIDAGAFIAFKVSGCFDLVGVIVYDYTLSNWAGSVSCGA